MRYAFAGTPRFAAWVLEDLVSQGTPPCLVVSQPDRPAGRGRRLQVPPVVRVAQAAGLSYLQTADINEVAVLRALAAARAEVLVVAAFGQFLREDLLEGFLCVNVHASLLPAYRGAAPIERALMAGEAETGVSIMRMTAGLDEGPCALQKRMSLGLHDDATGVTRALALLGALGTAQVLTGLKDGTVVWTEQPDGATYAAKLGPTDRVLDFEQSARAAHDQVRALSLDRAAEADLGVAVKILRTWPHPNADVVTDASLAGAVRAAGGRPGRLLTAGDRLVVGCGEGALQILALQPAGKRPMSAAEFLRGYGARLAETARAVARRREGGA